MPITALDIYREYPRKKARARALKAITKAMKRADPKQLLDATRRYAQEQNQLIASGKKEKDKIPYPEKWYNGDQWLDEPDIPPKKKSPPRPQCKAGTPIDTTHMRIFVNQNYTRMIMCGCSRCKYWTDLYADDAARG